MLACSSLELSLGSLVLTPVPGCGSQPSSLVVWHLQRLHWCLGQGVSLTCSIDVVAWVSHHCLSLPHLPFHYLQIHCGHLGRRPGYRTSAPSVRVSCHSHLPGPAGGGGEQDPSPE